METGSDRCGFSASKGIATFLALRRKRRCSALQGVQGDSSIISTATVPPAKRRHSLNRQAQQQQQQLGTWSSTSSTASATPSPLGPSRQSSAQSTEPLTLQQQRSDTESERLLLWVCPVPAPPISIQHTYIVSSRILQHPALVSALKNPSYGGIEFIERDFEYMREFLPPCTRNRAVTRLEADLILDEANAVLLYPLASIGQAGIQDPEEGLNELRACIDRINRRYGVLWLILEEYAWAATSVVGDRLAQRAPSLPATAAVDSNPVPAPRLNRYTGPVVPRLVSLLSSSFHYEHQNGSNEVARGHESSSIGPFSSAARAGPHSPRWGCQTRVLFASSEETAARMIRQIGDGLLHRIDDTVRAGLRREDDGWRSGKEWLSRNWLNHQDSTHERFLSVFQVFNPFSVQAILSLCSLREFLSMSTQQRHAAVGKFTNGAVLAQFDRMLTTPSPDQSDHSTTWL